MSEDPLIDKLGRFTPTAVDRDAMLFAAGRASVRPARFWKWATAALVLSHALILGVWLRPPASPIMPPPEPVPAVEPALPDPYSLLALSRDPDGPHEFVAAGPTARPLTAFSRDFQP